MFSRQVFAKSFLALAALTAGIYINATPAAEAPNPAAPTSASPDPAIGTKPDAAAMHCAVTQYMQWVRARTAPPDPDVKARKLQEIDDLCGSSLHLAHVQSGYEAALGSAAAAKQLGTPDGTAPNMPAPAARAVPTAPPAVQATRISGTISGHTKPESKETVSSVLTNVDESQLVVMTDHFHYIFDLPAPLLAALKGSFHPYVQAAFSKFHVDIPGATSGTVTLSVTSAPDEALASAIAAGFTKTPDGAVFVTTLHGFRYYAGDVHATAQYKLNKPYEIEVEDALQNYKKPSPIMMAAGYLTFYGILLVVAPQAFTSR
jgi:hypothetical protein